MRFALYRRNSGTIAIRIIHSINMDTAYLLRGCLHTLRCKRMTDISAHVNASVALPLTDVRRSIASACEKWNVCRNEIIW